MDLPHVARHAFGGQMGLICGKKPCNLAVPPITAEKIADFLERDISPFQLLGHMWPYSQVQWPYSVMQSGASPGSPVGNTNDWILFLWSVAIIPCLFSGLLPRTRAQTPKTPLLSPKHRLFIRKNEQVKPIF